MAEKIKKALRITIGNREWELSEKQEKFIRSNKRNVAGIGGRGSGKSEILCLKMIQLLAKYPNNAGLIAREDYADLRMSTQQQFLDIVGGCFKKNDWTFNKQAKVFTFKPTNSTLMFMGLKDVSKMSIRSLNLGFYALEQAEELDEEVVNELDACLRRDIKDENGKPGVQQAFFLANPFMNWIYRRFIQDKKDDCEYIKFSMIDNIANLSDEFISRMNAKSEAWKSVFVFGNFDTSMLAESAVFAKQFIDLQKPREAIMNKGGILIYEAPDRTHRYQIGADPSEGIHDNCVAKCIDLETGWEVASFVKRIQPALFGEKIAFMGNLFNQAKVVLELQGGGLATLEKLKELNYSNLYMREEFDKHGRLITEHLGWKTTSSTKPLLISNFNELLESGFVKISDEKTLAEMRTFVYSDAAHQRGMGAQKSFFDDRVIGIALAYFDTKPKVVDNKEEKKKPANFNLFLESMFGKKEEHWLEL